MAAGLALALVAWLLIWSAITGSNPLDEIRAAFGVRAERAPAPRRTVAR